MSKEDVRQIVGDWRSEQQVPPSRDTQFAGFAAAVIHEIDEALGAVVAWGVENDIDDKAKVSQELATRWLAIMSRRAYDLVGHTLDHTDHMMIARLTHEEQIAEIPDLTELPE